MTDVLDGHVLVPVADPDDARATAAALVPYQPGRVTVFHVIEKGGGVPDKTPVEQSETLAAESLEVFRERFPDAELATDYRRDVVESIVEAGDRLDVDAIAFRPRGGPRIVQFLAGDRSLTLVTQANRPVVSLPDPDSEA
jgi:nucleotide-binding universal stress UspA family protein